MFQASRPVQEYMKIPLEAEAVLQETAQFLARQVNYQIPIKLKKLCVMNSFYNGNWIFYFVTN